MKLETKLIKLRKVGDNIFNYILWQETDSNFEAFMRNKKIRHLYALEQAKGDENKAKIILDRIEERKQEYDKRNREPGASGTDSK